jgi:hypothetical protein
MLHAGLDLSRNRLDVCLLSGHGELVEEFAVPCDLDGVRGLARRVLGHGERVRGVIESMTGARFVHDTLERDGWDVLIADAQKVKGLAPLACKTDKIDARVLAVLSERDLVPEIWLPDPAVRREREQARFRLHLVKHRSMLKHRIHSTLITFGKPCPVTDLFGVAGRRLLDRLEIPQPWRASVDASLALIDDLERQIAEINGQLRAGGADHPYCALAAHRARDRLGTGVYDRRRDRRHHALCLGQEAVRLHRAVSTRAPVRREGSSRPADQARPKIPALGDARGDHARPQAPPLSRALPTQQETPRPPARRQGRPDRHRQEAHRSDLAHAHPQPTLRTNSRSGRRHSSSGRVTAPNGTAPPKPASNVAWSSHEEAIER